MVTLVFLIKKNADGIGVELKRSDAGVSHPEEENFAEILENGYCNFIDEMVRKQNEQEAQLKRLTDGTGN